MFVANPKDVLGDSSSRISSHNAPHRLASPRSPVARARSCNERRYRSSLASAAIAIRRSASAIASRVSSA